MRLCRGIKFGTNAAGECAVSTSELPDGYNEVSVCAIDIEPIRRDAMLTASVVLPLTHMHLAGVHVRGSVVDVTPIDHEEPWQTLMTHFSENEAQVND